MKLEQQLKQLKTNQDFRADRVSFLNQRQEQYSLGIPEVEEFNDTTGDRTQKTRFQAEIPEYR